MSVRTTPANVSSMIQAEIGAAETIQGCIKEAMELRKIDDKELAKRVDTTPGHMYHLLFGDEPHLTVKMIARIFSALEMELKIFAVVPDKDKQ